MSDPIPKTMPRSTLACPPAKNLIDQYSKANMQLVFSLCENKVNKVELYSLFRNNNKVPSLVNTYI